MRMNKDTKKWLALVACSITLCAIACGSKGTMEAQMRTQERNKAVIRKWFTEVNKDNFESLYEECFDRDCKQYMPPNAEPVGFEEYKPMARGIYESFPEIDHQITDLIAEGDRVVATIWVRTMHEGAFFGIPATGKNLEWTSIAVFRLAEGKIKARWEIADVQGILEQLESESITNTRRDP